MREYSKLAAQFSRARRAWKRAAALSGLCMVLVESAGIFALLLLFDWAYRAHPAVRLGVSILAMGGVLYLLARHVVAPLFRRIPDEQVALYVEEHRSEFEGALITAAEFGRRDDYLPQQAGMIGAVVQVASVRAEHSAPARAVDLGRLRKYGLAAAVLMIGYAASFLFIPDASHRASRVLRPWQAIAEDQAKAQSKAPEIVKPPIEFALSYASARIPRGSSMEVQAVLSRSPGEPVILHFRAPGKETAGAPGGGQGSGGKWQELRMEEIEKLNGYRSVLSDLNEDVEFFVSAGPDKSLSRRIAVYDPLVLQGIELITHYPDYLKLPDRVETQTGGDVAAPVGSRVAVRILANRPLVGGKVAWETGSTSLAAGGATQDFTVDPEKKNCVAMSFEVLKDGSYTYRVVADDGQEAAGSGPCFVRAIPDEPPTVEMKFPEPTVTTHPLGEVSMIAEAADDFGVEAAELVYMRGVTPGTPDVRVPLQLRRLGGSQEVLPGSVPAVLNFRLEDLSPKVQAEEVLSYYVECRDRKGQKAATDIALITVAPFDIWGTLLPTELEEASDEEIKDLEPYLRATWHLHRQKEKLVETDFNKQCEELAATMIDPQTGKLYAFHKKKIKDPVKAAHAKRADTFIQVGHKVLAAHDTGSAVANFRLALAELALAGLITEIVQEMSPGNITAMGQPQGGQPQNMLEAAKTEAERKDLNVERPKNDQKLEEAKLAEDIKKKAAELEKKQDEIIKKTTDLDKSKTGEAQPESADSLAGKEDKLADQTKGVASEAKQKGPAAPEVGKTAETLDRAAQAMRGAAQQLKAGNIPQALNQANKAKEELRTAQAQLKGAEQEKLENVLAETESRAARLLERQRNTRGKTEEVAKAAPPDKKPDAKQERDLKKLTYEQVQHKVELANVQKDIEDLQKKAKETNKGDAAKEIDNAHREMQRGQIDQKMTNAVVELDGKKAATAVKEQKEAESGLEKVVERLRRASDALAADPEAELRRAKGEAERIERDLSKLGSKPTTASASSGPAEDKGEQKPAGPQEKTDIAERVPYEVKRLADHLENRALAEKMDTDYLKNVAQNAANLNQQLTAGPTKADEMLPVVRRVRNKLEAEYLAQLEAQRLFTAQREECPPQYRHLVNKYYEAISKLRGSSNGGK